LFPVLVALLPLAFIRQDQRHYPARSQAIYAVGYILVVGLAAVFMAVLSAQSITDNRHSVAVTPDLVLAADWAKVNTPRDSLFYFASASPPHSMDMSQFRVYAERSVSHSYKDLSMVAYSHAADLVRLTSRQEYLEDLARTPEGIRIAAREIHADYILLKIYEASAPPEWVKVYQNAEYAIYRVQ
jgi:hypothetical protein